MSARALLLAAVCLSVLGGPGPASAQTPAGPVFDELAEGVLTDAKEIFAAGQRREQLERAGVVQAGMGPDRPAPLEPESAAAAADRLSLSARSDLSNVEAGASIAPFALLGSPNAPGFRLTAAALKEDKVRFGTGYTWDSWRPLLTLTQLGLSACVFDDKAEQDLRSRLDLLKPRYETVCARLVEPIRSEDLAGSQPQETAVNASLWTSARVACGLAPLDPAATPLAKRGPKEGLTMVEALANIRLAVEAAARRNATLAATVASSKFEMDELKAFLVPQSTQCRTTAQIREAFLRTQWSRTRRKIGLAFTVDLFPRRYGFNPETDPAKELPHGEVNKLLFSSEISWARRRTEWAIGAGLTRSRETHMAEMTTSIAPSLSLSWAAFGLAGHPITVKGLPNLSNGKLPPHAVLGLKASAEIAFDPPDSQTTSFNSVSILPFADFKITEKLTFRVGIPVRAEIKRRAPSTNPPLPEQRSLQWTVPFSIATLVKL